MGIDVAAAKKRLEALKKSTANSGGDRWYAPRGKTQIRIVPYKHDKDNPFIELYFHYNFGRPAILSPASFGRPDPIVEFSDKLKETGDRDEWKLGRKLEPKERVHVPVIVRGKESDGIKYWGFNKTIYADILGYIADPDYGDITDPTSGRDITVERISSDDTDKDYDTITIRIKPNVSPLTKDAELLKKMYNDQAEIADVFEEPTYEELQTKLTEWLHPDDDDDSDDDTDTETDDDDSDTDNATETSAAKKPAKKPTENASDDVAEAFDSLFSKNED